MGIGNREQGAGSKAMKIAVSSRQRQAGTGTRQVAAKKAVSDQLSVKKY